MRAYSGMVARVTRSIALDPIAHIREYAGPGTAIPCGDEASLPMDQVDRRTDTVAFSFDSVALAKAPGPLALTYLGPRVEA